MSAHWYVIRTATRQERKVEEGLKDLAKERGMHLDVYLPCETQWSRSGRVKTRRYAPLLPGYLFLLIDRAHLWRVEKVWGVHMVLRTNGGEDREAAKINPDDVCLLRMAQANGDFDFTKEPEPGAMRKGERYKIKGGWIGELMETPRNKRARLVVSMFGKPKMVTALVADLEPQDREPAEAA